MGAMTSANPLLAGDAPSAAPVFVAVGDFTFNSSYATGGDTVGLKAALGLDAATTVLDVHVTFDPTGAVNGAQYDIANDKLIAYVYAAGPILEEVAAAVDLDAVTVRLTALCY